MADEPKPTDTPAETGTVETGAGGDAAQVETPEQKAIRERDEEIARLRQTTQTQAGQLRAWQPKVEAMNALERATGSSGTGGGASPAGAAGGGSLAQQIAALEAERAAFMAQGYMTATQDTLLHALYQQQEREAQQARNQAKWEAAKLVFDALADRELAAEAERQFQSGKYWDPDAAVLAAKGVFSGQKPGGKKQPDDTPPKPRAETVTTDSGGAGGGKRRMANTDIVRILEAGGAEARRLQRELDSGAVAIDITR